MNFSSRLNGLGCFWAVCLLWLWGGVIGLGLGLLGYMDRWTSPSENQYYKFSHKAETADLLPIFLITLVLAVGYTLFWRHGVRVNKTKPEGGGRCPG